MAISIDIKKKLGDFTLDIQFKSTSKRIGILGASGCGKSMTLKSIAGIETPDQGSIVINGKTMFDSDAKANIKPQKRNVGYLFQNYALFPTMTVAQNIAVGIEGRKAKQEVKKRVQEMIKVFRLEGLENNLPSELSGGQQQRAALARIMAYEPDVILLDEPFSALDMYLKNRLQQELLDMMKDYQGTVIMVSHSRDEIYRFSEELLIMEHGKVVTFGNTKETFADPCKKEAAKLTGCKNFSKVRRIDEHCMEVLDWGICLNLVRKIPEHVKFIGYRAHEFVPVWGDRLENCIQMQVESMAELPFEKQYYLRPESMEDEIEPICWFVQKDKWKLLEEKGAPDYLQLMEEYILFLED